MTESEQKPRKTWARELATALIVYVCVLLWQEKLPAAEILVLPAFTFAFMAYGVKNVDQIAPLLRRNTSSGK